MNWVIARLRSFLPAIEGVRHTLQTENNARIHLVAAITAILVGVLVKINYTEWLFVITAIALVWITELLNTAIESLCDKITRDYSKEMKVAKDASAAGVLVAAIYAVTVAAIVFGSKILG